MGNGIDEPTVEKIGADGMPYSRTQELILKLEADEDGNLDLESVTLLDGGGCCCLTIEDKYRMCDVCAAEEEFSNVGVDCLGMDVSGYHSLKLKGHIWWDGPDHNGECDGGIKVVEVLDSKEWFNVTSLDDKLTIDPCPVCHGKHVLDDPKTQVTDVPCGEEVVRVYIKDVT